jgi:hypothetical protein
MANEWSHWDVTITVPTFDRIMRADTFKGQKKREKLEMLNFPSPLLGFYSMLQGLLFTQEFLDCFLSFCVIDRSDPYQPDL